MKTLDKNLFKMMVCWMLNNLKDDLMYKVILSLLQIKDKV